METGGQSQETINPPQHPRKRSQTVAPRWRTYDDGHVDEGCKADGKGCEEQALVRMAQHSRKDSGIQYVPQARQKGEEEEEDEVEHEENDGNDAEPVSVVRQLMEQDGYDASAHRDNKPSVQD